ncbi:MAG: ureidoglycolate lyase [Cyanobacteria bacterium]|nr:ureidoglycolate lyase [Cyanobacteriota bacterium]
MATAPVALNHVAAINITPENFAPFGQVILPLVDGTPYGPKEAQLQLDQGTPRFYIMQLLGKGRRFHAITRHRLCTQCLGAIGGRDWFMAVAPPSRTAEPDLVNMRAFRVQGDCFIKLHVGTWHAGPLFDGQMMNFYNLELSDTNITDHETCDLRSHYHLEFEIV